MKFKSIIIYIFILNLLFLTSCDINSKVIETINIIENDDERSDLYASAGLSGLKMITAKTDPFNLQLSHGDYFYSDDIYVEITCDIEDAEIYYTTNNYDPKKDSDSLKYTGPVLISKRDSNAPVILKAIAFLGDDSRSDMLTHTYFISEQIDSRFNENLYIFSISTDYNNLWDHDYGIYVAGRLRAEWREANPHIPRTSETPDLPANFNIRGRESERPAYVEVLNSKGEHLISQSIGLRIRGGWSRDSSRKSLGLYARSEYDPIFDKFYYDFFHFFDFNEKATTMRGKTETVDSYSALMLRNGGNDRNGAHMREELSQMLAKKAGFTDYKEVAPATLFLNGEYFGFFWLQQFYPNSYFDDNYGEVPKDNIEIKEWTQVPDAAGITDNALFEEYARIMDLDNFMFYYAFHIYVDNRDWPHNNLKIWRYAGERGEYINPYYDGKYRFLFYDAEMGWGMYGNGYKERTIQRIQSAGSSPSFNNLMQRADMVEKFCNQMWDLLHTIFTYESIFAEYTKLVNLSEKEIYFAIGRSASSTNERQLEIERESILEFAGNREKYVRRDMALSFRLTDEVYTVSVTGKDDASVKLNTIDLNGAGTIESCYFTAHSVKLSTDTQQFDYWLINGQKYATPELILNNEVTQDGNITAELFLK